MTPREEHDLAVVTFAKQVGIVVAAALGVVTLTGMLYSATFGASQTRQDRRIDRLVEVVELQAVINVEPPGSVEQARALAQLRQMRSVVK